MSIRRKELGRANSGAILRTVTLRGTENVPVWLERDMGQDMVFVFFVYYFLSGKNNICTLMGITNGCGKMNMQEREILEESCIGERDRLMAEMENLALPGSTKNSSVVVEEKVRIRNHMGVGR